MVTLEPILIIGAGSFSVDTSHLWNGIPFRYNILDLNLSDNKIDVKIYTREREPSNPNWKGAYIYTDKDGNNIDYWEEKIILSK